MPIFPQAYTPTDARAKRLSVLETEMRMQEAQAQAAQANQLRQFYQQMGPGIAAGDPQAIGELARIDPTAAQTARKTANEIRASEFESQKKEIDFVTQRLSAINYAPEDLRPLMYRRMLAEMSSQGADVSAFPQEYDPQTLQVLERGLMSVSERMQAERIELERQRLDPNVVRSLAEAEREPIPQAAARAGAVAEAEASARSRYREPTAQDMQLVTVEYPDGRQRSFRRSSSELDQALSEGAVEISTANAGGLSMGQTESTAGDAAFLGGWDPAQGAPDPTDASGIVGLIFNAANTVADYFHLGTPFRDVNRAKEALTTLDLNTRTILQDAVPGRPSTYLMQQFDQLVSKPMRRGDEGMVERLNQTRSFLNRALQQVERYRPQTPTQRGEKQEKLLALQDLVAAYDEMLAAAQSGGANQPEGWSIRKVGE